MVAEHTEGATEAPSVDEHINRLRSAYDSKIASLERSLAEERRFNDDNNRDISELNARIEQYEARGMEDADPRLVEAIKQRNAAIKVARAAEDAKGRFTAVLKSALVESATLRLAQGDSERAKALVKSFERAKSPPEIEAIEAELREAGFAGRIPAPTTRTGDEVDAGRSGGRGAGGRITQARIAEIRESGDTKAWEEISDDYWAMLKAGKSIPER